MIKIPRLPLLAIALAIVITTTMDFTGYFAFSALSLLALILIFWAIQKQSLAQMGLRWGAPSYYLIALLHPLWVMGLLIVIAVGLGDLAWEEFDGVDTLKHIGIAGLAGWLVVLLTEEGFFRGWLWAAVSTEESQHKNPLWITSVLFVIWHISAVTSGTEYGLPWSQIPVYLLNVLLLGLIWGMLRMQSGSVVVAAFAHAIWNGLAYELFGFGTRIGDLGISKTWLLGPEVGYLGVLLNGIFCLWLWRRQSRARE